MSYFQKPSSHQNKKICNPQKRITTSVLQPREKYPNPTLPPARRLPQRLKICGINGNKSSLLKQPGKRFPGQPRLLNDREEHPLLDGSVARKRELMIPLGKA